VDDCRDFLIEVTLVRLKDPRTQYPMEEDMEQATAFFSARHIFSVTPALENKRPPLVNCFIGLPMGELMVHETAVEIRARMAAVLSGE
jgi:hypothetical protein